VVISFIAQPRTRAFCHPVPGARITLPYQQRLYLQPSLVGIASWANPAEARTGIKPPLAVLGIWHEETPAGLIKTHSDSPVAMASAIICLNWRQPRD